MLDSWTNAGATFRNTQISNRKENMTTQRKLPRTRQEAEAQGYTVDTHVYPWVAYRGPRFNPTEWHTVLTDKETHVERLADALRKLVRQIERDNLSGRYHITEAKSALAAYEKETK